MPSIYVECIFIYFLKRIPEEVQNNELNGNTSSMELSNSVDLSGYVIRS